MNQDSYLATESTETIEPCEEINQINNNPEEVRRGQDEATRSLDTKVQQAPGCSTAVLSGLSKQIIDEMNRIEPGCLVSFADLNVQNGAAVNPFLQPEAKAALARATQDRGRTPCE